MVANVSQSEDDESRRRILIDRLRRLNRLLKECLRLMDLILSELQHDKDISLPELRDIINTSSHGKSIKEPLITQGLVKEDDMLNALSQEMGLERVDLSKVTVTQELLDAIPSMAAKRYRCFPVAIEKDTIYVALSDPLNIEIPNVLNRLLKKKIICMIAPENEIEKAIRKYYEE